MLGSAAFKPVKNDMLGNIKKIRDRQLAAPAQSETLQALVVNELKEKKHTATEGLLWLVRYVPPPQPLPFSFIASQLLQASHTDTAPAASTSPPKPSAKTSASPPRSSPTLSAAHTATRSSPTTPSSSSPSSPPP